MKELRCLYLLDEKLAEVNISQEEVLMATVMLIPPAWQFPETTQASIDIGGGFFQTPSFRETAWMMTSDIIVNAKVVGQVNVCYLEERRASDEGSFLVEERQLLDAISLRLGVYLWRKKTQAKLYQLSSAIEQNPISILITDTLGRIEFVNPQFTKQNGYSAEEAIGQYTSMLKSGLTTAETYKKLWSTISAGIKWDGILCNKRKDGSLLDEHVTISPLLDSN